MGGTEDRTSSWKRNPPRLKKHTKTKSCYIIFQVFWVVLKSRRLEEMVLLSNQVWPFLASGNPPQPQIWVTTDFKASNLLFGDASITSKYLSYNVTLKSHWKRWRPQREITIQKLWDFFPTCFIIRDIKLGFFWAKNKKGSLIASKMQLIHQTAMSIALNEHTGK